VVRMASSLAGCYEPKHMSPDSSGPSPVSAEALASLPAFYHPIVSPDGTEVAFYYDGTGRNELHVMDLSTGEHERLTDGEVPRSARWHLVWGGTGERVYFHRDEDGDEQNDVCAVTRDGDVETVVAVDGQAVVADTTSDGRYVLFASDAGEQMNLYRQDRETGERDQLTTFDQPVWGASFGPDDERVAFTANESDQLENQDPYVMDADGSNVRRLDVGDEGAETRAAAWFPDGERLLVGDNSTDLDRVGVYDLEGDAVTWSSDGTVVESPAAVSPDGRRVVVTRKREAATMPAVHDLETGEHRELDVAEGVTSFPLEDAVFADETTVVFGHTTSDRRPELYRYDLATDESGVVLAADYEDVDPDVFVGADHVTYESEDGTEIGALLYDARETPDGPDEDSPAVVMVHGGPHARSSKAFDLYAQFLVTRGYTVLQPNYRGSTGRGREFKHAILGDWGGMEQIDVAEGAAWLADRDWVDADRLAVFGGSYGGYSAYCQLTMHPEHWATGVAWIGITDLLAMYDESMPHFQHALEQQLGDPEENEALWRERSPITHVENMEAPVFVIHGVNDPRCPISQARRFRDALEDRGWEAPADFEYEELGAEGHGSTDSDHKLRAFELLGGYLDRRL